jgi:uncharacterized protein YkwD
MRRSLLCWFAVTVAVALAAPAGAQARTPCPAEQSAAASAPSAQVSDAIFCLTNQIRAAYGLAPFRRDARLDTAARLHSEDMADRDYFAHVTPEGLSPSDRAAAQGYSAGVGENIAAGYATARAVIVGWMNSTGHCRNILGSARDIGVGTAPSPRPNYTQDFGDYDFGASSAVPDRCPLDIDLDTLAPAAPAPLPALLAALPAAIAAVTAPPPSAAVAPVAAPALDAISISR